MEANPRSFTGKDELSSPIYHNYEEAADLALNGVLTGAFLTGTLTNLLASDAAAGQPNVVVVSASYFCVGQGVTVSDDNTSESLTILAINYGTNTLTMTGNLVNAYATADNAQASGPYSVAGLTSLAVATVDQVGTDWITVTGVTGTFQGGETGQQGNGPTVAPIELGAKANFILTANGYRNGPALFRTISSRGAFPPHEEHELSTDLKMLTANARPSASLFYAEAVCSADLALSNAEQDVTGATLTLAAIGSYRVTGIFDFDMIGDGDMGQMAIGRLSVAGVIQTAEAHERAIKVSIGYTLGVGESVTLTVNTNVRATVVQIWDVTTTVTNTVVKLRALRDGGTGASVAKQDHTKILAESLPTWAAVGALVRAWVVGE